MGRPPSTSLNKIDPTDITLIEGRSKSHTPPFLLTFEIFNKNLHNCLVDLGASSNILSRTVCEKLNVQPQKSVVRIVELDRSQVKFVGELNQLTIRLSSNPKFFQVIDILVANILEFYGLILSRDWSEKLHGYFATDWSHMWLPYNGKPNQIRVDHEKHQKYIVTKLEGENEPVMYSNNIIGVKLTSDEKSAFMHLLKRYKNVFAWNYEDIKTYDTCIIQHTIPMTSDERLVQQKLRKIHPNLENQIKSELNKPLKSKIIFLIRHSRWVSNLVPIRKKNGDIRICIDFGNLNKTCQKDNFPLPPMEQIFQSIAGSELMSFLDGFSGYNKILVHPYDQLKTTFKTKWGTYDYQNMSFGLINVGATFQRAMDIAFKGLVNKSIVIYLDDITVYSRKNGNHLKDLKQIFEHCQSYGIYLKPKKSFFTLSGGKILGFIVSKVGIHIDPDRIREISEIPLLHNKKSMKSFLG
eukprot:PITA_03804